MQGWISGRLTAGFDSDSRVSDLVENQSFYFQLKKTEKGGTIFSLSNVHWCPQPAETQPGVKVKWSAAFSF